MDTYTTKSGDMWDNIAKEVYGSEYDADILMQANPLHIGTFIFSAGTVLNVPDIQESNDGTLPPWKFEAMT
jgi:phage tail protein X